MIYRIVYFFVGVVTRFFLLPGIRSSSFFKWLYGELYFIAKHVMEGKTRTEIKRFVREGMTAVDVGANVGYYTVLLSQWVGHQGKVVAFEPDPFLFGILARKIKRKKLRNVEAVQAAVSDQTGEATLYICEDNLADNRICRPPELRKEVMARSYTLDDFFGQRSMKPNLIKMDIQGAEPLALKGMRRLIAGSERLVLISEFAPDWIRNGGTDPVEYLRELRKFNFRIRELGRNNFLSNDQELSRLVAETPHFTDVVCELSDE